MTDVLAHDAELDAAGLNCPLPLQLLLLLLGPLAPDHLL